MSDPAVRLPAFAKPLVFGLAALPALGLAWRLLDGSLTANPYQTIIRESGLWSLRLLVIGFAVTPLSVIGGLAALVSLRRMLGLFAAFYAALHLIAWAKDYGFDLGFLASEIAARLYLAVGFVAALALLVLAASSGRAAERRLGTVRWRRLHRLVELAIVGSAAHWVLARRIGMVELITYGAALAALFSWRYAPLRHRG